MATCDFHWLADLVLRNSLDFVPWMEFRAQTPNSVWAETWITLGAKSVPTNPVHPLGEQDPSDHFWDFSKVMANHLAALSTEVLSAYSCILVQKQCPKMLKDAQRCWLSAQWCSKHAQCLRLKSLDLWRSHAKTIILWISLICCRFIYNFLQKSIFPSLIYPCLSQQWKFQWRSGTSFRGRNLALAMRRNMMWCELNVCLAGRRHAP